MANDKFFAAIKRGDNGQYLDGMVIDTIDEFDYDLPFDKIVSEYCRKVYLWVEIDRKLKDKLLDELMLPTGFTGSGIVGKMPDPVKYRVRGCVLPIADIAVFTGKSETELRDQTTVRATIDCKSLTETAFKSSATAVPTGKIDKLAVTSGSYTVGTAKDYATWALFTADIGTPLAGNLTGTQQTDTTENTASSIAVALAGYSLTLTSDATDFENMFNSGRLSSFSTTADASVDFSIACTSASSGALINISFLKFKKTGTVANYGYIMQSTSNTSNITTNINDCLLDSNSKGMTGLGVFYGTVYNVFNVVAANGSALNGNAVAGIVTYFTSTSSKFENCTLYNYANGTGNGFGFWSYNASEVTFKNMVAFNNGTYDFGRAGPTAAWLPSASSKCASSDTSGSEAGLRSLVSSTEFTSLNIADNDFLNADPAETLADAGTAPGIAANTYGIRGNARPHGALYSVGSDEVAAATAASLMVGCLVNKRYPIKSLTGGLLAR